MVNSARNHTLRDAMQEASAALASRIEELLPRPNGMPEDDLFAGMRYAAMSTGKRLRPFLTMQTAHLLGVDSSKAMNAAIAIELIHTYSLVHDDLPALDNDDLRRGKPTCHKKFGEATAILVGDALLTYAFELAADSETHPDARVRIELVSAMAKAAGFAGMVGGQVIDMGLKASNASFAATARLQRMKTGALFVMSCDAGAILAKAHASTRSSLQAYANSLGLAFQIMDDLADEVDGSDSVAADDKPTLIFCLGREKAEEHARFLASQAVEHLSGFDHKADLLRELAEFVVSGV